jgi:hypothetical protein
MKQKLLLLASLLTAGSALANIPQLESDLYLTRISADGNWAVSSDVDDTITLVDLKNDEWYTADGNYGLEYGDDGYDYNATYGAGYGNAVSNTGIVVGSYTYNALACYWQLDEDGELAKHDLPALGTGSSCAHGITPDGSRIVGYSSWSGDYTQAGQIVLAVPILWQLNDKGEYELIQLPCPTADFSGRTPQYVMALCISEDGKTIAGQLTCGSGFYHSPVVFHEGEDGTWSYELLHSELQSHDLTFPKYYEYNGPEYPQMSDYMSEETQAAYEEAYQAYVDSGYTTSYPTYRSVMTEEELAAYDAAYDAYSEAMAKYEEEIENPYYEVFYQAMELGIPDFMMNQLALSGNGRYYGATSAAGDYFSGYTYSPFIFDLQTDSYKEYTESNANVTYINNNGVALACETVSLDGLTRRTQVLPEGADDFVYLDSYIAGIDEEAYDWMATYMASPYLVGYASTGSDDDDDWELLSTDYQLLSDDDDDYLDDDMGVGSVSITDLFGDDYTYDYSILTGISVADAEFKTIVGACYNGYYGYGVNDLPYIYSYIYKVPGESGVGSVQTVAKGLTVKALSDGQIRISGNAKDLKVYDLSGRCVFSTNSPAATVNTGLKQGAYIVRATDAAGKATVTKAVFQTK